MSSLKCSVVVNFALLMGLSTLSLAGDSLQPIFGGTQVTDPVLQSATFAMSGCSGFMISKDYGITARHCSPVVGDTIIFDSERVAECPIESVTQLPNVDSNFDEGDFVLLKVNCGKSLSSSIRSM